MKRIIRDCAGTSMLEAAIITPLLLLLTFAICDFSSMFYVYLALENGASLATRYAVTGNVMPNPSNPATQLDRMESIKLAMRQATPSLAIPDAAFSFHFMPPGGSTWQSGVGGPGDIGKVTIDYTWHLMTPLLRPFFTNGDFHVTVDSAMKNETRFQ
jgi:TadE-like protein